MTVRFFNFPFMVWGPTDFDVGHSPYSGPVLEYHIVGYNLYVCNKIGIWNDCIFIADCAERGQP
jgi:hypothetical protein